jgi:hypothetical protein
MKIRYDFWSLVVALKSGLTHAKATPDDRAKKIVDGLAEVSPEERHARIESICQVVDYLQAILDETTRRQASANSETRIINPVAPATPPASRTAP